MPITLRLPPPTIDIDIAQASFRAARLSQTLAMAYALSMREGEKRPHWIDEALKELNELADLLKLEPIIEQPKLVADPVDALFERANIVALNGQVLR